MNKPASPFRNGTKQPVIIIEFPINGFGGPRDSFTLDHTVATRALEIMFAEEVINTLRTPYGAAIVIAIDDLPRIDHPIWKDVVKDQTAFGFRYFFLDGDRRLYGMNPGGCSGRYMHSIGYVTFCREPEGREWRWRDSNGYHWEVGE